jgi:hypothetical protein
VTPTTPQWVAGVIASPNGGLKAAPSLPQKQNSEHTRQKEVNSTCELDLLCTAVVVVLVTNLIYFSEKIKKSVGKKNGRTKSCFAMTPYKGIIREKNVACGTLYVVGCEKFLAIFPLRF